MTDQTETLRLLDAIEEQANQSIDSGRDLNAPWVIGVVRELRVALTTPPAEASSGDRVPDPQSFIPGYRIRFIELDQACAYLVDQGWAGGISFDEAVKALGRGTAHDIQPVAPEADDD